MYAQQSSIDPSLAALLQTAQMVTPDQTPTVAAQVAQAAAQKMQPQGIAQGMPQARQDFQAAMPSMMRNMQQAQMQQMVQQAMQPKPAGIEGLPSNIRMAEGGVVGYAGPDGSFVGPSFAQNLSDAEIERLTPEQRKAYYKQMLSRRNAPTPVPPPTSSPAMSAKPGLGIAGAIAKKLGPLGLLTELFTTSDEDIALLNKAEAERNAVPDDGRPRGQENYEPVPQLAVGNAPPMSPEAQQMTNRQGPRGIVSAPPPPAQRPPAPAPAAPTGVAALAQPKMDLSRYEKAGEEDRAAIEKIIAAQEANAREKAAYMTGRPKFEQEGIAALTKANQAREELLSKERADDAYNRQQALLDQIGRRNINAYSQEQGRQRQRDLAASEAQRLYEQAVIKQREAEFLQGAGRFEEAKKALDDKEKILSAMQTRINQSRTTEAGIAERQFTGDVQMFEGAQNRAQNERFEILRRATANQPGEAERIEAQYNRLKATNPAEAEQYLQRIERIKGLGKGISERQDVNELKALISSLKDQADPTKNFDKSSREQASVLLKQAQDKLAQMSGLGGGGTRSQAPMYAKNPKTNERIMSTDGGQTWKPAQ
jgi:hypothetical protein